MTTPGLPTNAIDLLAWLVDRDTDGDEGPIALDLTPSDLRAVRRYLPRLVLYGLAVRWSVPVAVPSKHWGRDGRSRIRMVHARPTTAGRAMIDAYRSATRKSPESSSSHNPTAAK